MAYDPTARLPRRVPFGFRGLDHLETGLCDESERGSSFDRVRMHGSVRKVRHHSDTIRAVIILGVVTSTGGAGFTTFYTLASRGKW